MQVVVAAVTDLPGLVGFGEGCGGTLDLGAEKVIERLESRNAKRAADERPRQFQGRWCGVSN